MNTMQLRCFVEVAALISFSKAAEALHVSQPTVSHQIKALEDELGCALLVRSTRTVRLTDDGFAFLEYANDIHPSHAGSAAALCTHRGPPHRLAWRAREAGAPARDPRPLHRDPGRGAAANAFA